MKVVFAIWLLAVLIILAIATANTCRADPSGYQDDSGLPTPPPPLPTQIVNGDGTRLNCTPSLDFCWN